MLYIPNRFRLPTYFSVLRSCAEISCASARSAALSFSAWSRGDLAEAVRLAAASGRTPSGCEGNCPALAEVWHAALLIRVRETDAAEALLAAAGTAPGGGPGSTGGIAAARLMCAAELAFVRGDVDAAAELAGRGVRAARQAGLTCLLPDAHTVLALGALRQGSMSVSLDFANRLRDDALLGQTLHSPGQCAWAAAQLMEVQGGAASAAHLIAGIVLDDELLRELLAAQPAAAAWLVRAACALGDVPLAQRVAEEATALAGRNDGLRSVAAAAAHSAGLLAQDPERVLAAAAAHRDPWAAASACEDAGRLLAAHGEEPDRAVEALERAVDGYTRAGSPRDARRVVSRLRALGVRRGRYPQYAGHDRASAESLTNTEAAVAELVSHGFTNSQVGERLFISGHTVAFHLKKIFRKMNVTSRVELTRAWSRMSGGEG